VALSRASSLEGLQVVHFNPLKVSLSSTWEATFVTLSRKVKAHAKVIDWYRTLQLQAEQDAKDAEC